MRKPHQVPFASGIPLTLYPNDWCSTYTPPRLILWLAAGLFAAATQLDLIAKTFKKLVQERHASPQFLMGKLEHKREKSWRLNNRLFIASQCFADCDGNA